jgi:hypothetical protein
MKITHGYSILVALLVFLCAPVNASVSSASQDAEIYSSLFRYILKDHKGEVPRLYVSAKPPRMERVLDTAVGKSTPEQVLKGYVPAMSESLRAKFLQALNDREEIKIDTNILDASVLFTMVSSNEPKQIFDSWLDFKASYPDAKALIRLSHTAIDDDGQTALVYMDSWCGGLCGSGYLFVLAKLNNVWRVVSEQML